MQQIVKGLSGVSRGSLQEKLDWAFELYDINGDGFISKEELNKIMQAIYDLLGKNTEPPVTDVAIEDHMNRMFSV